MYNKGKIEVESSAKKTDPYKGDALWNPSLGSTPSWLDAYNTGGSFSTTGYKRNSPDVNNTMNIVPSNHITMEGVDKNLLMIPMGSNGVGNPVMAQPGNDDYFFPRADMVMEMPVPKNSKMRYERIAKNGGQIYDRLGRLHSINSYVPFAQEGGPSSSKAREMLRDGTAHGKALTPKQKRYFGWIAGGRKQDGGTSGWLDQYQDAGEYKWDLSQMQAAPETPLPAATTYTRSPEDPDLAAAREYARRQAIAVAAQESGTRGVPLESAGIFDPIDWMTGAVGTKALVKAGAKAATIPKSLPGKSPSQIIDENLINYIRDPKIKDFDLSFNEVERSLLSDKVPVKGLKKSASKGEKYSAFEALSKLPPGGSSKKIGQDLLRGKQPLLKDFQFATTPQDVQAMMAVQIKEGRNMPHWFDLTNPMDIRRSTFGRMLESDVLDRGIVPKVRYMTPNKTFMKSMNAFPNMRLGPRNIFTDYQDYVKRVYPEYTSFTGQDALQQIQPNKYGGISNWLDDYNY